VASYLWLGSISPWLPEELSSFHDHQLHLTIAMDSSDGRSPKESRDRSLLQPLMNNLSRAPSCPDTEQSSGHSKIYNALRDSGRFGSAAKLPHINIYRYSRFGGG